MSFIGITLQSLCAFFSCCTISNPCKERCTLVLLLPQAPSLKSRRSLRNVKGARTLRNNANSDHSAIILIKATECGCQSC